MSGGNWLPPTDSAPPLEEGARPVEPAVAGLQTAHYLSRVGAAVVDFCVRLSIMLVVLLLVMAGGATSLQQAWEITAIVGGVLASAYAPVMIARTGGQTLGHQASQTRIVRADGTPLDGGGAVIREVLVKSMLFEGLAIVLAFIPTLANYLWPLWDERGETLHDKLCRTRVVEV